MTLPAMCVKAQSTNSFSTVSTDIHRGVLVAEIARSSRHMNSLYRNVKDVNHMKANTATMSNIESSINALTEPISVPNIIGNGPIMTIPPPFVLEFDLLPRRAGMNADMNASANPAKTRTNPI